MGVISFWAGSEGLFLPGASILVGIAWTILARIWTLRPTYQSFLPIGIVSVMVCLQMFPTPQVLIIYREWNREARNSYSTFKVQGVLAAPGDGDKLICPGTHPYLTWRQAIAIHRFLATQD